MGSALSYRVDETRELKAVDLTSRVNLWELAMRLLPHNVMLELIIATTAPKLLIRVVAVDDYGVPIDVPDSSFQGTAAEFALFARGLNVDRTATRLLSRIATTKVADGYGCDDRGWLTAVAREEE